MRRASSWFVLLAACASPIDAPQPSITVDAVLDPPSSDPDLEGAACERCHVDEARAWRASGHRTSFVDEVFQAEWRPSEQAACVRCHAPLADPDRPEGIAAADGVSCVACHVRDGAVRAGHAVDAPHAIVVDPTLRTSEACAGCHDFTFAAVAPTIYSVDGMLQGTVHEWHEVEARGVCQDCHMRSADGRVSHAFPGARDEDLLARALHVEAGAASVGDHTEVTLTVTSRAGHAVPTGDMFRRLEVEAWIEASPRTRARETWTRRFASIDGVQRQVSDDRVPAAGERTTTLSLPRARRIAWRVTWQALDPALARVRWLPEEDVARTIAEGTLDVPPH